MFSLHKATIISPYVSGNIKRKLHSCDHTYDYKIYGRDPILTECMCEHHMATAM